jgi:hypothetical protein
MTAKACRGSRTWLVGSLSIHAANDPSALEVFDAHFHIIIRVCRGLSTWRKIILVCIDFTVGFVLLTLVQHPNPPAR